VGARGVQLIELAAQLALCLFVLFLLLVECLHGRQAVSS
jgi:hypothetical protein